MHTLSLKLRYQSSSLGTEAISYIIHELGQNFDIRQTSNTEVTRESSLWFGFQSSCSLLKLLKKCKILFVVSPFAAIATTPLHLNLVHRKTKPQTLSDRHIEVIYMLQKAIMMCAG